LKKVVIISLIVVVVIILLGKNVLEILSNTGPEPPDCRPLPVKRGVISLRISGRGLIKPMRSVVVRTRSPGQVQEVLVQQGQRVTKGQRLFKIKPLISFAHKLSDLKLRLDSARFRMKATEKNLERQRKLYSEGLVALMAVESAQESYTHALRQVNVIEEAVRAFEEEIGEKISNIGAEGQSNEPVYSYITAPITGTVIAIQTHVGETVPIQNSSFADSRNDGLLIIADLSQFQIEYKVSEIDINKIRIGQTAEIRPDSYPDLVLSGTIDTVSAHARPKITSGLPGQRTDMHYFTVTILLGRTDPRLKPGMSCRVSIIFEKKEDILLAPVEAVAKENGAEFVYTIESDSFVRKNITTGVSNNNFVEITSGLSEGTLLCGRPLVILEWEELRQTYQNRSFLEKIFN
jgi:RND family efflux transporter MFP subunit